MMHSYQSKYLMRELTLVMRKQHSTATVNLVTLYFQLTLITIVEYVARYSYCFVVTEINITTSLTCCSVLNAVLLCYVTHNISYFSQ